MRNKSFKSLDEQVEILKSRGLRIDNEVEAKTFLMKNNYYRVSGYSLTLRKNDCFFYGTTFNNIADIYNFDYELRHILLKYLEISVLLYENLLAFLAFYWTFCLPVSISQASLPFPNWKTNNCTKQI